MSQAAKVGIGLGVPLGLVALAALVYLGYRIGKKRASMPRDSDDSGRLEVAEIDSVDAKHVELQTTANIMELPANSKLPELSAYANERA